MLKVDTGIMAEDTESFPMLGSVYRVSGAKVNQMSKNLAKMKMNTSQTRVSQVNSSQSNNISSDSGPKACWYPQNPSPNVWGQPDVMYKIGKRENVVSGGAECKSQQANSKFPVDYETEEEEEGEEEGDDSDSDIIYDSDDDISIDGSDDESHEKRKKSKWFNAFFDDLGALSNEKINSHSRQWHCPACFGGPGAIDWYQGLQPLMNHAKTVQSRRVRLHRQFARILEYELLSRKAEISISGEVYGRWEGLGKQVKDYEIVWPPMVVVMNTKFEQDEHGKV